MITVANRQRGVRFDLEWLRQFAVVALEECRAHTADQRNALRELPEVEVTVVSDRKIAEVHEEFMAIPDPTDVITFEHGEIVIGAGTAVRQAREYGEKLEHELARYIVHGLLHLNGFDDLKPADHRRMHAVQERVMKSCLARMARA